jgi:hypothetical protein
MTDVPMHSLEISALTDERDEPRTAVQYSVVDRGSRHIYGDQSWVAYGEVLRLDHLDGRIECRDITITYGEWRPI